MKRLIFFLVILANLFSCARVQTLNTKPHDYSIRPNHIIWIQLAGFSDDHIPLVRFNSVDSANKTWFENMNCIGKMWNYNLYELRPKANSSFMSQMLGSRNIKNNCSDFDRHFFWENFKNLGYKISIIESGANEEESIDYYQNCKGQFKSDFNNIRLWKMSKSNNPSAKFFHYQDSKEKINETTLPGTYFDKSCQNGNCYSNILNNLKALYSSFLTGSGSSFLIVRNFNYLKSINSKNISAIKENLNEVEQILKWIYSLNNDQILVVLTGAEARKFEFPEAGKKWEEFDKTGKNFTFKQSELMSPVIADGPMAENFCGIFEESEIANRFIFQSSSKKFNWELLNPFSN